MIFLDFLTPLRIYVFLTFIIVTICYDRSSKSEKLLFLLMLLATLNEIMSVVLKSMDIPRHYPNAIFIIVHCLVWLFILDSVSENKKMIQYAALLYLLLSAINLILLDGQDLFRYSFIFGALLYVVIFIWDSSKELRLERLEYFTSERYILIVSPILFFIGFSLIFAFKEKRIGEVKLTSFCTLYDFTSYFVNIIYYTLINLYIYRRKKAGIWSTT